jgi:drug/metabolite transporter (DMT)-like permease
LEIVGKKIGNGISPFSLTAWRFLIGGLILLPFAIRQIKVDNKKLTFSSILYMGVLGILNVCASMLLLQLSIFYGKASMSAIIVSLNPLFVTIFASIIIKERINLVQTIGLAIGAIGMLTIIWSERDFQSGTFPNLTLSVFFALAAAMTFGLYTVLTKKTIATCGNIVTNCFSFLFGSVTLMILTATLRKPLLFELTPNNITIVLYLGIVITGIAYLLYFEGMKGITASKASMYFFLKPVIASVLAVIWLSETLVTYQVIGIMLIILSLGWERLIPARFRKS